MLMGKIRLTLVGYNKKHNIISSNFESDLLHLLMFNVFKILLLVYSVQKTFMVSEKRFST